MRKLSEFNIEFDRKTVFHYIDCYPESPVYEEAVEEYEQQKELVRGMLQPRAVMEIGTWEDGKALFLIATIGDKAEKYSTRLFAEGNYLGGMLVDSMADYALFQMEEVVRQAVAEECAAAGFGVSQRVEAPLHVPMSAQRTAFDVTDSANTINIRILDSFMLDPVKSNCQIYLLTEDTKQFHVEHDCSICPLKDCKMRTADKNVEQAG